MKVMLWLSHSIEEYDMVRLMHELGHEVLSVGGYIDPRSPHDVMRPALDIDPVHDMKAVVDRLGQPNHPKHGKCDGADAHWDTLDAAKRDTPDELIEWADVLLVHHLEHTWLVPQWDRIKGRCRVIWRTVGQSAHPNEWMMKPLRKDGLEIVRYSPKERSIPEFAGEDALIRFYKDPDEWNGWTGDDPVVTNVTQNLYRRSLADDGALQIPGYQWTSFQFWDKATEGLPRRPGGPGSEMIGGTGPLTTDEMKALMRSSRAYVATGTQPASYVLNFIEALMTGIPVVSLGPDWFCILPYGHLLLEQHELSQLWSNDPKVARNMLVMLLNDHDAAKAVSVDQRAFAIETFGIDTIKAQWASYLGQAETRQVTADPAASLVSVAA
jgi:hypothetical protein